MHQSLSRFRPSHALLTLCTCLVLLSFIASVIVFPRASTVHASPARVATTQLTLKFTCAVAVDYQYGKVCVHTQPGAALTIKVKYCSGYYATSKSLKGTRYADSNGNYTWHWVPQTTCHGSATAYVTATWMGQTLSKSKVFIVQ